MRYLSTRGQIDHISFSQAVLMGLSEDGGLLLPRTIPRIGTETLSSWKSLDYCQLAFEIMSRFIDDIPDSDLQALIERSYTSFSHDEITPLVQCGDLYILELFHGPTLAFKDVALQFLGNLFEYLLEREEGVLNILGATSGDTGSAAIYGIRNKKKMNIFILHPHQRISPIQEKQMTTVLDDNVYNIAIRGSFDDGQAIVKELFSDVEFKNSYHLGAINSINWARILAQVVYYVYSYLKISEKENLSTLDFAVPTGNFGDIFAGYIAKKMLPEGSIRKLVLATNDNDILSRFINDGEYLRTEMQQTSSPSMDIQAASNFERYLYYLLDEEPKRVRDCMTDFANEGKIELDESYQDQVQRDFSARSVNEAEVLETIASFYQEYDYVLDPHTAVGVTAAMELKRQGIPIICLATAHPAKFDTTVHEAINQEPEIPEPLQGIIERESRCEVLDAETALIRNFIEKHATNNG